MIYEFSADEVLQMAVDVEVDGIEFYGKAEEMVDDVELKKTLKFLGDQEVAHKEKFLELKRALSASAKEQTVWDPESELCSYLGMMAELHVFKSKGGPRNLLAKVEGEEDVLDMAIRFEKDSILFFYSLSEMVEDEEARKTIGALIKEEQNHLKTLAVKLLALRK